MKTTLTVLEEAADLERALEKRKAKFSAAKSKHLQAADKKLDALVATYDADIDAIRSRYGDTAVKIYDSLQSAKSKAKEAAE